MKRKNNGKRRASRRQRPPRGGHRGSPFDQLLAALGAAMTGPGAAVVTPGAMHQRGDVLKRLNKYSSL